ncbi:MAG: TolC family protein [Verrucomicrobia bacterium]|nr:TolC family protein [Verrucomicrobiota bacterium]
MMSSLRLAISTFALAASLPVLHAQTAPAAEAMPLTLEMCVTRALEQNFDVSIQRISTSSASNDVELAKASYDPTFSATTARSYSKTAPDPTIAGSAIKSEAQATDLAVSQKIVTGATVTARGALDRNNRISGTTSSGLTGVNGLNPSYLGDVSLRISQPLLKGAGPGVNRAAIRRARLGVERANFDLKGTVLSVIRSVEAAYYNVAFAREQREVRRFSLAVAQKLLEENKVRRSTGVTTDLEVLQSEVGVATAQRNLVLSEQTVHDNEDALLQLIGRFEFDQQLGPIKLITDTTAPEVSFDKSYKLARDNTPEFLSSQRYIEQLKLDLKVNKNQKLPGVDLGGGVGYTSEERSYRDASREVWAGKGYNWQVDLTVSVPWKFRAANASYRQAQLALNREQTRLQQLDQNILVDVRTAIRSVETNLETVRLSQLSTELSLKQFEQEKARYEAGLSTFRFVQQSQATYDDARVSELQARVNLRIALAELSRLEGSSLQHYNVVLAQTK